MLIHRCPFWAHTYRGKRKVTFCGLVEGVGWELGVPQMLGTQTQDEMPPLAHLVGGRERGKAVWAGSTQESSLGARAWQPLPGSVSACRAVQLPGMMSQSWHSPQPAASALPEAQGVWAPCRAAGCEASCATSTARNERGLLVSGGSLWVRSSPSSTSPPEHC